jgi:hypothetical protein
MSGWRSGGSRPLATSRHQDAVVRPKLDRDTPRFGARLDELMDRRVGVLLRHWQEFGWDLARLRGAPASPGQ